MNINDEILVKKLSIQCSFCNKNRNEVNQMIEGPQHCGHTLYICDECITLGYNVITADDVLPLKQKEKSVKITPEYVKKHMDQYIIGQDDAKIAISVAFYNHYKRNNHTSDVELEKSNLLIVGPSGSGKTLSVKTAAKLLNFPYVIVDATSITEAGYHGSDVEDIITSLISAANNDIELAQKGVIFIDEIDKKCAKQESSAVTRDVSGEGVQQSLLKIMEGTILKIDTDDGVVDFDTTNILFVFSGAFVGLEKVIKTRSAKTSIGINAQLQSENRSATLAEGLPSDFIKFGLIPEFVGRCPIMVVFEELTNQMICDILIKPKNSIISQFTELFKIEGVTLTFDDKYLTNVADKCIKQGVGARGLRSILEKDLQAVQFVLPTLSKSGVSKICIDANGIANHSKKLKKTSKQ